TTARADHTGDRRDRSAHEGDERVAGFVSALDAVYRYHDGTKHHSHRFARSLDYLDWASQPNPFRSFAGAPESAIRDPQFTIGDLLRHALGLSAWKQFGASRWSLRVNPSSGNLHPTEAYVVGSLEREPKERGRLRAEGASARRASVFHYAADRHALEERCAFDPAVWREALGGDESAFLVALTSIHWREAWKYGERAFRYCQHDLGHAIAAVSVSAALHGLQARVLPDWSHADMAALTGIDRDADFTDAEREEPGCVLMISRQEAVAGLPSRSADARRRVSREPLLIAVRDGRWVGRASQLSEDHVQWTTIDEIAEATRDPGHRSVTSVSSAPLGLPGPPDLPGPP